MTYVEQLVKVYLDSRERLIKEIERRIVYGRSTYTQEQILKAIDREIAKLNLESNAWTEDALKSAYEKAARLTYRSIASSIRQPPPFASFGAIHVPALKIAIENTKELLAVTNITIGRQAKDVVRQIGVEMTQRKLSEMMTVHETKKALMARFQDEGFFTVPYRSGKGSMRVDSYSELVARTTTREATMTATYNQAEAMGCHLYKMSEHSPTCKVCAPRQGRVYRTIDFPEGDERNAFSRIEQGFPRWPQYKTVHPNCMHVAVPYIWNQKTDEQKKKELAQSSRPFDLDPRGERERKRYEEAQRKNAERLRDRKQWERYRAVLGKENTPRTLSAFRSMKRANSESFKELQALYRKTNRENAIIEAAKSPSGRHSGKYNDATKWSDTSVKRAARSYRKTAEEHLEKMREPAKYDKNWDKKTPEEKQGLLKKWEKDYTKNDELRIIMEKILKERGIDFD